MENFNTTLWITLILISVKNIKLADSFQCFECENCATIGHDEREYIKDCAGFEGLATEGPESTENSPESSTSSTRLGTTSTDNPSSSLSPSTSTLSTLASLNNTETTQKLVFGSTDVPTTIVSTTTTTEKQKVTSTWSLFPNSVEEKELNNQKPNIEDRSEELFSWKSRQDGDGVCYVLKLNYEGHEVINRGCGLRGQNKDQICQILSKGEPNSECEVCEGNLCNSASGLTSGVLGFLVILFVLKAYI
ncbi:uncharacterized protein LOC129950971 [Eupeodes corollae]|uniref:uncharacterized protein LOC129950971 n=1 Tax=Eupeodes corollae TaxID=290404 RepID=UPI00248F8423|nr:uncharacterized protein LOC129950971 [Eupeodes corollae]